MRRPGLTNLSSVAWSPHASGSRDSRPGFADIEASGPTRGHHARHVLRRPDHEVLPSFSGSPFQRYPGATT
jgi:hypothetical protein